MAIKFEKGQIYNVVKTLGVIRKSDGRMQISQHTGKDGVDITPAEKLSFVGNENGKLWFLREDGSRVSGHKSHFDVEDAYYVARKTSAKPKDVENIKAKVAKKAAELELAVAEVDALLQEEAAAQAESADLTSNGSFFVNEDVRNEAAALFME
jgi:hypothetical protein